MISTNTSSRSARPISSSSTLTPAADVKRLAAESAAAGDAPAVSFCNTGHWAAINWFALSEVAGQKGVKMYPGSMVDWSQGPGGDGGFEAVRGDGVL